MPIKARTNSVKTLKTKLVNLFSFIINLTLKEL